MQTTNMTLDSFNFRQSQLQIKLEANSITEVEQLETKIKPGWLYNRDHQCSEQGR